MANIPTKPINRLEQFYNAIATGDASQLPTPITREEAYLAFIAINGGGGGGGTGEVTGVKGEAETIYRKGKVNLTPENLGIIKATTSKVGLVKPDNETIEIDANGKIKVKGGGTLESNFTSSVAIGSVTNGKAYPQGTKLETIIRDMLTSYNPPTVTLTTTPSTKLYDVVTDSVNTIVLKAAVTKKTNPVTKVSFYVGSNLVNEVTSGVASGGNFQYQYTPSTAIKTDTTFKATATDGKQTTTSTFAIKFVGRSYYGICDASVSDPDATVIKSGSNTLKDSRNFLYSSITTSWGKVFYAYPKSFGALTYIKDEVNNVNYFDSFQRREVTVDGIDYYCYTLIQPTAAEDNQITFK